MEKLIVKSGLKLSVLLVEDEPEIMELLVAYLQELGCFTHIIQAKDGQDALIKYQNQEFDLIITDLIMPKAGGFELISNIIRLDKKKNKTHPFIVFSGGLTEIELKKVMRLGVKHFLTKPCSMDVFLEKVSSVLLRHCSDKVKKATPN